MAKHNIQIKFHDYAGDSADERWSRTRLRQWLEARGWQGAVCDAEFFPSPRGIGCYVEISLGASAWRSFEHGPGVNFALLRCLRNLTENTHYAKEAAEAERTA